ncbi:hypothetical protein E2C01_038289 [Portunus trituberculatus]|uniref:Uncharacterized protein n=1 Tax=Portunus trituberculatus TaxID=210409 RepID=A0A5B7FDS8_PORTR|nr:hypothetical protein [Portunus trituberculatus]
MIAKLLLPSACSLPIFSCRCSAFSNSSLAVHAHGHNCAPRDAFRLSFRPIFTLIAGFSVFPNSHSRPVSPYQLPASSRSLHSHAYYPLIRSLDILRVNQRPVSTNGLPRFPVRQSVNGRRFVTPHFRLFIPRPPSQGVD